MKNPTRVHLLRHGQVEGYEEKRYNGQADIPLTVLGRRQSASLAGRFQSRRLAAIYSSDLQRCRFAADQIALFQQVTPLYRTSLRELCAGDWEGVPWAALQRDAAPLWQARLRDIVHIAPPGGESFSMLAARVRPELQQIISSHPEGEVVIVSHGGVNRLILLDALGAPLESVMRIEQDYACHNIIDYYPDRRTSVSLVNGR
ncbi:MAG: histidine phosphatase family protein [Desulfuromonadales bacterium]|nr:histidine phosphatase family protein [Desulfuromonadales bacterium]